MDHTIIIQSFLSLSETMSETATNTGPDTCEKILDAAESLFIEHGFAATSVRAIAARAGVNLAATNYHFGSKKGLFAAVLHRRIQPINQNRLQRLAGLQHEAQVGKRQLTLRSILEAFFEPLKEGISNPCAPALIGRMYAEPESLIRPILEEEFQEVAMKYIDALATVMPQVSGHDLRWRFHFLIGSMIHLLQMHAPLGSESTPESFTSGFPHLIDFVQSGLRQTNNGYDYD